MIAAALLLLTPVADLSLAERYPCPQPPPSAGPIHTWEVGAEDAFRLTDFAFEHSGQGFRAGPSTLVIGAGELGAVWAVVLPDEPGTITGPLRGSDEPLVHAYLRFHPAEIDALFPPDTVEPAPAGWRAAAGARIALAKQRSSWQSNGQTIVPPPSTVVLDCCTAEPAPEGGPGRRRFYMTAAGSKLAYYDTFEREAMPREVAFDPVRAEVALEALWESFDAEYAMFGLRDVDWMEVHDSIPDLAAEVGSTLELALAALRLVEPLDDRHAWVRHGSEYLLPRVEAPSYRANFQAVMGALGPMTQPRQGINWGRTEDGIGYFSISALDGPDLVEHFDTGLEQLDGVSGLVIDLRFNTGGDETIAQRIAGRFADAPRTYARHRFRADGLGDELGPWFERTLEPRGERIDLPLRVLIGPATMSSGEAFALMFAALPDALLVGQPSAGSSGNPRVVELPGGVAVGLPRWLAALPDGTPLEGRGVVPDLQVDGDDELFVGLDPIFHTALDSLRQAR